MKKNVLLCILAAIFGLSIGYVWGERNKPQCPDKLVYFHGTKGKWIPMFTTWTVMAQDSTRVDLYSGK